MPTGQVRRFLRAINATDAKYSTVPTSSIQLMG